LSLLLAQVGKPELCHMAFGPLCVNLCAVRVLAIAAPSPALVGSARSAKLRWESGSIGREIASSTSYKIDQALERLEKIDNNTKPKQRKTNKAQILRDPVPNSMLEDILKADKPKGAHQLTWARFQLASVILFFSGLRINEIACIRK